MSLPGASSSPEKDNFVRLCTLLVDEGTALLREIFDAIHPPATLKAFLSKPETTAKLTKGQLYKQEEEKVYPSGGGTATSQDFDITLLCKLLKNVCNLTRPFSGWRDLPDSVHTSQADDLVRIRIYRNDVTAHAKEMKTDNSEFERLWREISSAMIRLANHMSSYQGNVWTARIAQCRSRALTFKEEQYVQEVLDWQKQDRELKEIVTKSLECNERVEASVMILGQQVQTLTNIVTKEKGQETIHIHIQGGSAVDKDGNPVPVEMQDPSSSPGIEECQTTEEVRIKCIKYHEDNLLGVGSQGEVYEGTLSGRRVAVKRMYKGPGGGNYVKDTAEKLKKLDHPNVIRCFEVEEEKEFVYVALELCEKKLTDCVKQNDFHRKDSGLDGLRCLREITGAVTYLHDRNICHRDINPDNILLSRSEQPRFVLADCNIAKNVHSASTVVGSPPGTLGYIAPELYKPEARITTEADLFSLGCVFYYVISNGRHPFGPEKDLKKCQTKIRKANRPPTLEDGNFSQENIWTKSLIARMLSYDPVQRPNATVVSEELEKPVPKNTTDTLISRSSTGNTVNLESEDYADTQALNLREYQKVLAEDVLQGPVSYHHFVQAVKEAKQRSIADNITLQEHRIRLHRHICEAGLQIRKIGIATNDGNCLFHAVSDQLQRLGLEKRSHRELRLEAVQTLRNQSFERSHDDLSNFVERMDLERYLNRMSSDGEWGDHLILAALSHALDRPIRVVLSTDSDNHHVIIETGSSHSAPILLGLLAENHFESLEPATNKGSVGRMSYENQLMTERLQHFKDDLKPAPLLSHISCLTDDDKKRILSEERDHGINQANTALVDCLKRQEKGMHQFVQALKKTGNEHVALLLDPKGKMFEQELNTEPPKFAQGYAETTGDIKPSLKFRVPKVFLENEDDLGALELQLREYQKELAAAALLGKNSIICAPKNSSKTYVAVHIAKEHLDAAKETEKLTSKGMAQLKRPKVVFIVNTVNLVSQQKERFQIFLSNQYNVSDISGAKRYKIPLTNVLQENDVVVMTAQILVNALKDKENQLFLSDISLLIFDKCHHAQKEHPYNRVMEQYLSLKLQPGTQHKLPQVVGLTASLGVGNTDDIFKAQEHILQVCANLDAECVSTVRENVEELSRFANTPDRKVFVVSKRTHDMFEEVINEVMAAIEKHAGHLDPTPPRNRSSQAYCHWLEELFKRAATDGDRYLVTYVEHLRVYHVALDINSTLRMKDAMKSLDKYYSALDEEKFTAVDRRLKEHYSQARKVLEEFVQSQGEPQNPNLKHLKDLIVGFESTDVVNEAGETKKESKGIVFTTTKESTRALLEWIEESEDLKAVLRPGTIVGGGGDGESGMTRHDQDNAIKRFKSGEVNILLATNVAEEGLDISDCDYVIRYNVVGNEISSVQSRGRVRAKEGGKFFILAKAESGVLKRETLNKYRELLMADAVGRVQKMDPEEFNKRVKQLQKKALDERYNKRRSHKQRQLEFQAGDVTFFCRKCRVRACQVHHLRSIRETYRVIRPGSLKEKVTFKPHPRRDRLIDGVNYIEKVFCGKCNEDWGVKVIIDEREWISVKMRSFVLEYSDGSRHMHKQWKDARFKVEELTEDDLQQVEDTVAEEED